jgi:hypothetical protein
MVAEGSHLAPDQEPEHQRILRHVVAKLRDIARSRISLFGASGHGKKLLVELDTAGSDYMDRVQR